MTETKAKFIKAADHAYARFAPLAKAYYYNFRRSSVTTNGVPYLVFLGNHSSGKSSLINWILGGNAIQDVGLAPTDDGFTVLIYGEKEEEVCGPAAISLLPKEFQSIVTFGPSFLQHFKVKVRNREILKGLTLVDTPGMIDSAEGSVSRAYDFEGVVRAFAEKSDMVFFLLDPDKPGTTGETVNVFSRCLGDVQFKLRVLLNKCDSFTSLFDFARTYGTVCWNLARVLRTKDLPKIWTIYSGGERTSVQSSLDFSDFNRHRVEFMDAIRSARERRYDNVFSQSLADFLSLSVRMSVLNHVVRSLCWFRLIFRASAALALFVVGHALWIVTTERLQYGAAISGVLVGALVGIGLVAAVLIEILAVFVKRTLMARRAEEIFAREYKGRLVVGVNDNLKEYWAAIRDDTVKIIRTAPLHLPLFGEHKRRCVEAEVRRLIETFQETET